MVRSSDLGMHSGSMARASLANNGSEMQRDTVRVLAVVAALGTSRWLEAHEEPPDRKGGSSFETSAGF
jgi:hypothetical protein